MRVPEQLKALMSDLCVRCSVHKNHDEKHDVASKATWLCVVNAERGIDSQLPDFDIIEVDVCEWKSIRIIGVFSHAVSVQCAVVWMMVNSRIEYAI